MPLRCQRPGLRTETTIIALGKAKRLQDRAFPVHTRTLGLFPHRPFKAAHYVCLPAAGLGERAGAACPAAGGHHPCKCGPAAAPVRRRGRRRAATAARPRAPSAGKSGDVTARRTAGTRQQVSPALSCGSGSRARRYWRIVQRLSTREHDWLMVCPSLPQSEAPRGGAPAGSVKELAGLASALLSAAGQGARGTQSTGAGAQQQQRRCGPPALAVKSPK